MTTTTTTTLTTEEAKLIELLRTLDEHGRHLVFLAAESVKTSEDRKRNPF